MLNQKAIQREKGAVLFDEVTPARLAGLPTNKFCTSVVPFDSAANSNMRFESDFDPGSFTCPSMRLMG